MTNTPLLFVDTETTGLDPDRHGIWEVAAIRRNPDGTEERNEWYLRPDLGTADPMALRINHFWERSPQMTATPLPHFVEDFMDMARGCHLVGAVPSFDEERLRRLLRANGGMETWHYHIIDVEALTVGYLTAKAKIEGDAALLDLASPPWKSDDLSLALGVDPERFDRHTALGDVLWAQAMYDACI